MLDYETKYFARIDKQERNNSYNRRNTVPVTKHKSKKSKEMERMRKRDIRHNNIHEKMTDKKFQLKSMRQWAFWEDYIDRTDRFDSAFDEVVLEDNVDVEHIGEFISASLKAIERV